MPAGVIFPQTENHAARSLYRSLLLTAGGVLFALLATANGAGYRYGASDQAFYIPVVARALDPSLFPRDGSLIDAEGRLIVVDDALAVLVRGTGLPLEMVFLIGYATSLALTWAGLTLIGRRVYRSTWTVAALGAAFTMRHRIPRTSVNSFEPYFNPRMLAFGLGTLAIAALLRRHAWLAVGLIGLCALVHITTAIWFAVLVGVALAVLDARWRRLSPVGAIGAGAVLTAVVAAGPLRGSLATMDAVWLQAVASKDSLFAIDWPLWAWAANLGLLAVLWWAHRTRARRGAATPEDEALVWGATALVALFLVTLPFVAVRVSLAVQFQVSRVFWLVDLVALVYVLGAVGDHSPHPAGSPRPTLPPHGAGPGPPSRTPARSGVPTAHACAVGWRWGGGVRRRDAGLARWGAGHRDAENNVGAVSLRLHRPAFIAALLLAASIARGTYIMLAEHPERALFEVRAPDTPWEDAMRWVTSRPRDVHVLADPGHAWKYGTSVRVSAARDVLVEEVKDSALAIYSREAAARVVDRMTAVGDFTALTAGKARDLARRYDLDYLVTEADLPLPVAYRNGQFRIYSLADRNP